MNPVEHLLRAAHALAGLPAASRGLLTGHRYFPGLISGPFHHGLVVVFAVAAGLAAIAALASLLRGGQHVDPGEPGRAPRPESARPAGQRRAL